MNADFIAGATTGACLTAAFVIVLGSILAERHRRKNPSSKAPSAGRSGVAPGRPQRNPHQTGTIPNNDQDRTGHNRVAPGSPQGRPNPGGDPRERVAPPPPSPLGGDRSREPKTHPDENPQGSPQGRPLCISYGCPRPATIEGACLTHAYGPTPPPHTWSNR